MSFHDILFPIKIARGAIGGPMRNTQIFTNNNGREERNLIYKNSRRKWLIASSGMAIDDLQQIINFFEARNGRAFAFRFRDPIDNKSCSVSMAISPFDQEIAIGNGQNTNFQLVKNYGDVKNKFIRKIELPIFETVKIAINHQEITNQEFSVNYQTGQIVFNIAPPNNSIISAGFGFDNKVRFDIDFLELSLDSNITGRINDVELIEVL